LKRFLIVLWWLVALLLSACATHGSKEPVEIPTVLTATGDVNPDVGGRPSPIVVRVFQLRGDAEFAKADFFALYGHEKETLAGSLVGVEEFVLRPGEKSDARLAIAADTRYVAAIAAFRDINTTQWRSAQAWPHRHLFSKQRVTIGVSRASLSLRVKR
jgi:type VI secretion system protein VasD